MTAPNEADDIADVADHLFAARSALVEAAPGSRRFGVAEIVRFLADPHRALSMDEQRALFADARLRADYFRLKAGLAARQLPALAAASVGNVTTRRFDGGTIAVHASRVANQIYVVLRFDLPADKPRALLIEGSAGEIVKRQLPEADGNGEMVLVLDRRNEADETFLRLLGDPTSTGSLLL